MAQENFVSFEELRDSGIKYSKELLLLPVIGAQETLKHMTARPGVRYIEKIVVPELQTELKPYKPYETVAEQAQMEIKTRDLEVFLGASTVKFDPSVALQTIYGENAAITGDGQKVAPTAKTVLAMQLKSIGAKLSSAIWNAARSEDGTTTAALFNGFDTITQAEVLTENIAAAKGNYVKLTDAITDENAEEIFKSILYGLSPELRAKGANIYLPFDIYDKYCEAYRKSHGGIVYNTQFAQRTLEGSDGLITFVPLASKAGSQYIHIAPKSNMIYGYNTESDLTHVQVDRFDPYVLTLSARMFFGVQFATLDKRMFKVIELAD